MDFIPLNAPDGSWTLVLQFIALGLMLFAVPLVFKRVTDSKWAGVCFIALGLSLALGIVGLIGIAFQKGAEQEARIEWENAVISEVQDVYGIKLSHDEFVALDFPVTEPDEDFVTYGTITDTVAKDSQVEQRATTLIWSDGALSLSSFEGELTSVELDR